MNTETYKKSLEKELKTLEVELKSVGRKNPDNSKDWEPRATDVDIEASDLADTADNIENYESNTAILKQLETQYNNVKLALDKIAKGTYGKCEVDGKPIGEDRLKANPAARTCVTHMNQEGK